MPSIPLAAQQAAMVAQIPQDAMAFVATRYPQFALQSFFLLMQNAQLNSLTNRQTYVGQLASWYVTITTYVANTQASILAAPDQPTLSAITWDFSSFVSTDPGITLSGALAITN